MKIRIGPDTLPSNWAMARPSTTVRPTATATNFTVRHSAAQKSGEVSTSR